MYITPDLFTGKEPILDHPPTSSDWTIMPSQTMTSPGALGKRKRSGDPDAASTNPLKLKAAIAQDAEVLNLHDPSSLAALPFHPNHHHSYYPAYSHPSSIAYFPITSTVLPDRDAVPPPRARRRTLATPRSNRHLPPTLFHPAYQAAAAATAPKPPAVLTPCHICHKAPTKRQDLDGYTDCARCRERACYVCLRRCESGCAAAKICSACSVEEGEEGTVWCLDCWGGKDCDMQVVRMPSSSPQSDHQHLRDDKDGEMVG